MIWKILYVRSSRVFLWKCSSMEVAVLQSHLELFVYPRKLPPNLLLPSSSYVSIHCVPIWSVRLLVTLRANKTSQLYGSQIFARHCNVATSWHYLHLHTLPSPLNSTPPQKTCIHLIFFMPFVIRKYIVYLFLYSFYFHSPS